MRKLVRFVAWVMLVVTCVNVLVRLSAMLGLLGEANSKFGLKGGGLAGLTIVTCVLFGLSRSRVNGGDDSDGTPEETTGE